MPANLPPQYLEAEKRYRQAKTTSDKISSLEEMLAVIPKHKGTEKLQAELKRRLSKLKAELQKKKAIARKSSPGHIKKEGVGQVVLVGPPNVGKSMILNQMTKATSLIADYPFTTRLPVPGMIEYENVQIQLVDLPPIAREYLEPWLPETIKRADLILLIIDLGMEDLLEQLEMVRDVLRERRIELVGDRGMEDEGVNKKTLIVANKMDLVGAPENLEILRELYGMSYRIVPIAAVKGINLETLKCQIYQGLDIVRVYTKAPGKETNYTEPLAMKRGSNILDVAQSIHKDFALRLKFARIWGKGKYAGQMVHKDYIVQEGDVIEFHL
jgi:hypothetical protein